MGTLCGKCGRTLKNPDSIKLGFGPMCWARMNPTEPGVTDDKGRVKRMKTRYPRLLEEESSINENRTLPN